jgi:hypothetical protein
VNANAVLAEKRVREASAATKSARQVLDTVQETGRATEERFYNNLAIFSGGTITLSVTFLGYLKSLPNRVVLSEKLLIASWIVLLVCLVTAQYESHFYSYYSHFATVGEYLDSLAKKYTVTAKEIDNLNIVNLTEDDIAEEQRKMRQAAEIYDEKHAKTKSPKGIYMQLFRWSGRIARITFPVGLALLVLFAIRNM